MAGEPTFTPGVNPSFPINLKRTPRTLRAQFGDGYGERAPDGINNMPYTGSLNWDNLSGVEAKALTDFFAARQAYQAFLYQPPHSDFASAVKWIATEWSSDRTEPDSYRVSVSLEQCFDP